MVPKIVAGILLGLCMAQPAMGETIYSPSGQVLEKAACKSNPTDCMAQASQKCSGPYQVMDSESHAGGILADWMPGPITWYSMLYQCGQSDGQMPSFEFRGPQWRPPSFASCNMMGQSVYCWGN